MGFTPDFGPLIGPCAAVPGFYVAAGFNGNGTPWSCITGLIIAQMICDEPCDLPLGRIAADRFANVRRLLLSPMRTQRIGTTVCYTA